MFLQTLYCSFYSLRTKMFILFFPIVFLKNVKNKKKSLHLMEMRRYVKKLMGFYLLNV